MCDALEFRRVLGRLTEEPFPEGRDLGLVGEAARADDPVGIGNGQGEIERTHQAALPEIPGDQRCPCQRDALAVDGCVDRHAGLVEHRAARGRASADPGHLQPPLPVAPVVAMEEPMAHDVHRRAQRVPPAQKAGAADRKQLLRGEAGDMQARPFAFAMPDRDVYVLAREIDVLQRGADPEVDLRMRFGELLSRCTNHLAAKFGEVVTVSTPARPGSAPVSTR